MFEDKLKTELETVISKVYPIEAAKNETGKYLTYTLISRTRFKVLSGYLGLMTSTYQLDFYDANYKAARTLMRNIVNKLISLERVMTGPFIQALSIENENIEKEDVVKNYPWHCRVEFTVTYDEDEEV